MKFYDKILCLAGVLVVLASVGICFGLNPSADAKSKRSAKVSGDDFPVWTDASNFSAKPSVVWKNPTLDTETGWNYDLFSVPETTWLSGEKKYIAKELPIPPEEPFGVSLVSVENPISCLRITLYSGETPPTKIGKDGYSAFVSFTDAKGAQEQINFRKCPGGTKLTKKTLGEGSRTVYTLTPGKPVEIRERGVALKNFRIVRGASESGDGSSYTRYMATFLDRANGNREMLVSDEEFVRDPSRVIAVFRDDNSSRSWRYTETFVSDSDKPELELAVRESDAEPWKVLGNEPSFELGNAKYFVKIVDISAKQATMSKQSESNGKSKRSKVRQVVLDLVK